MNYIGVVKLKSDGIEVSSIVNVPDKVDGIVRKKMYVKRHIENIMAEYDIEVDINKIKLMGVK